MRECLRKRGWVEKFHKLHVEEQKRPFRMRRKNKTDRNENLKPDVSQDDTGDNDSDAADDDDNTDDDLDLNDDDDIDDDGHTDGKMKSLHKFVWSLIVYPRDFS